MPFEDTIAAIATPPGVGGIGIIRISGAQSEAIARLLYRSPKGSVSFKSHHLYHGRIISPATGLILDEVLITLMRKPHSYTGEDLLEIHGHGNPLILEAVLTEAIRAGARLAAPGEFTRRAFLNNRIDQEGFLNFFRDLVEFVENPYETGFRYSSFLLGYGKRH